MDEVEPEEHGQRQQQVDGHLLGAHGAAARLARRPREVERPGDRVDGADGQLDAQLDAALSRHGDPPVVDAVVDGEQLSIHQTHQSPSQPSSSIGALRISFLGDVTVTQFCRS